MVWFKRIFLFMLVNILVMTTISIVTSFLGLRGYMTPYGIDYGQLMAFCLIWGMSGAFISLAMSRMMAKWMMGVQVIDPTVTDPRLRDVVSIIALQIRLDFLRARKLDFMKVQRLMLLQQAPLSRERSLQCRRGFLIA